MSDGGTVLFIQGAGDGTHDEWDDRLVDSLRRQLGDGYTVRYPRMPVEADPTYAAWAPAIAKELAAHADAAVVVGHSVGGAILLQTLLDHPPRHALDAIVLLATPFIGGAGWPGNEFEFADDLGARLPAGVPVHLFQGLDDDTVPVGHADLYARAIPQARVHHLPGRDHQLNDDLTCVAKVVRALEPALRR